MAVEESVRQMLKDVLDVSDDEIKADVALDDCLGVDSTEMVEIAVGLKKRLNIPIGDNELKKTHSVKQIVEILKSKGVN